MKPGQCWNPGPRVSKRRESTPNCKNVFTKAQRRRLEKTTCPVCKTPAPTVDGVILTHRRRGKGDYCKNTGQISSYRAAGLR